MARIDLARARELLPQAVATQGPDFRYRESMDSVSCLYVPDPRPAYADRSRSRTGCLIGVLLDLAGETVHRGIGENELGVQGNVAHLASIDRGLFTGDATGYLLRAQISQDDGRTWPEALEDAERWVRLHGPEAVK